MKFDMGDKVVVIEPSQYSSIIGVVECFSRSGSITYCTIRVIDSDLYSGTYPGIVPSKLNIMDTHLELHLSYHRERRLKKLLDGI